MRGRRWLGIAAGVVVALAALAWWSWYDWLPEFRVGLREGERYGVDVSDHQGEIDWRQVATDDIHFAYIKATEGGDFVDRSFRRNWHAAHDAGLERGAYHFFTLCRPGEEQAENFLRTVPPATGALPPAIDLELAGNCSARPDRDHVRMEVTAFLDAVEAATGDRVVLYVGDDFEDRYRLRDELDRPVWHRRLLRRPGFERWWIWQFHDRADVDGIDGGADLNVMRGADPDDSQRPAAP